MCQGQVILLPEDRHSFSRSFVPVHYGEYQPLQKRADHHMTIGTHRLTVSTTDKTWNVSGIEGSTFEAYPYTPTLDAITAYVGEYFTFQPNCGYHSRPWGAVNYTMKNSDGHVIDSWSYPLCNRTKQLMVPYAGTFFIEPTSYPYGLNLTGFNVSFTSTFYQVRMGVCREGRWCSIDESSYQFFARNLTLWTSINESLTCQKGYNVSVVSDLGYTMTLNRSQFTSGIEVYPFHDLPPGIYKCVDSIFLHLLRSSD